MFMDEIHNLILGKYTNNLMDNFSVSNISDEAFVYFTYYLK